MMNDELKTESSGQRSAFSVHPFRVVIIGGGISGLAAAHKLVEQSKEDGARTTEVVLLEASGRFGGIISTERREGFLLEYGPDAFVSEKPEALLLAERIGLGEHLIETNAEHRRSFIVRGGRLRPVPEGFRLLAPTDWGAFLRSDAFSLQTKARIALDVLLPRGKRTNGDDESLADFVRRRFGRKALDEVAQPMVGGIYTADPEQLSLRATMPRFLDMERERRSVILALRQAQKSAAARGGAEARQAQRGTSGARYSLFLSFDNGMQMLTDRLAALLPADSLRLNTSVERLARDAASGEWRVTTHTGETIIADAVCLALPAHRAAHLLRETDDQLAAELASVLYASTATINLAYRREQIAHKLDGFGFVVPRIERRALLACTFASVKFKGRAPEEHVLLRAFVGGALQPEMFALDDAEMLTCVRRDLAELIGAQGEPLFTTITRWTSSMPQYAVGHLDRIERIRTRLANIPDLHLIGNAYDGAGIPDSIRRAEAVAEEVRG